MGRWWKNTVHNPPEDEERKVTFKGDPKALSKRWPILWRFCQNWRILKVERTGGFKLYFRSTNGQRMRYRWLIFNDYVVVRVGPEDVTFWAVCAKEQEYTPLKIADTGLLIPGLFRKDRRDVRHCEDATYYGGQADFV